MRVGVSSVCKSMLAGFALCAFGVAAQAQDAKEPFKIGLPASLSGKYVAYGIQGKSGVEQALAVWKSVRGDTVDGRKIELLMSDTQSDNALTVSIVNQLIQTDKINVLIGPDGSNIAAAAVPPWKKFKDRPIWLMPGGSSTTVEKAVGNDPYFFHTYAWARNASRSSTRMARMGGLTSTTRAST